MKFWSKIFFLILSATYIISAQADELKSSLKALLYSEKKIVRDKAAYQLAEQGREEARKEFISLIQTTNDDFRRSGIIALGTLEARNTDPKKREVTLNLLCEQLKDKNWSIRQAANVALGIIGDKKAIPCLRRTFKDVFYLKRKNCYPVREAAKAALDRIQYLNKLSEIKSLWRKGDRKLEQGNLKESLSFFKQIIAQDKKNKFGLTDDAEFTLGYIYAREGKCKRAISIFNNLLSKYPNFEKKDILLYCLSLCYLNLKNYQKGRKALLSLKQKFPHSQVTKNSKGLLKQLERF